LLARRLAPVLVVGALGGGAIYLVAFRPAAARPHRVARGPVVVEVFGSGSIESRRAVEVGFDVTGRIARLNVDQGDLVKAGQELGALEDDTFRADVALAEEQASLARAGLATLEAAEERAKAELTGALAQVTRIRGLPRDILLQQELDEAEQRHSVALANLAQSRAAIVEGRVRVTAADRALDLARASLARTLFQSPFDGLVLQRRREVGDLVVPGSAVLRVAATDVVWASVWVDETALDHLRPGLTVRAYLRSAPQRALAGRVERIGREVDRETRELRVDVALEGLPDHHAIGQRVDLWIEVDRVADAVRVPADAIVSRGGQEGVLVLDGARARLRVVDLGRRGTDWSEVRAGLAPDDVVLRAAKRGGQLADGGRVALEEALR
jgi:HlyD family secretion protein